MKILLTRHGQTDWNVEKRVQGRTDIELNDTGIKQAYQTREKLLNEKIDVIISSPLKRARKTAEIIGEGRNIPIIIDKEIEERAFGIVEGKNVKDDGFIEVFDEMWNYKINKKYEDAESIGELFERIEKFLKRIKEEYKDKTVLLVTHGGVTVAVRVYFEGIPEGMERITGLGLDNCEIKEYNL